MHGRSRKFRKIVSQALPRLDGLTKMNVPSSIYSVWGGDLGWPKWIFDGTSLAPGQSLPKSITVTDDLTILANFLDHVGPETLLFSVANSWRPHNSAKLLARIQSAPNLEAVVKFIGRSLEIQNHYATIDIIPRNGGLEVEIAVAEELELLSELIEHTFALYLLRYARMFEPLSPAESKHSKPAVFLRGGEPAWHRALAKVDCCMLHPGARSTLLCVPAEWCGVSGIQHDPVAWADSLAWLNSLESASRGAITGLQLKGMLRTIIENENRVPRLKEIAKTEGISERTLARRVASLGVTYQELIDQIRAELAIEMLGESGKPVSSIARSLGFSHSSSFARAFRQSHGCTPSEWRKSLTSDQTAIPDIAEGTANPGHGY